MGYDMRCILPTIPMTFTCAIQNMDSNGYTKNCSWACRNEAPRGSCGRNQCPGCTCDTTIRRILIAARERRHRRTNGVPMAMLGRRADLINGGTPTGMEAAVFRKHVCNLPLYKALNGLTTTFRCKLSYRGYQVTHRNLKCRTPPPTPHGTPTSPLSAPRSSTR